MAPYLALLCDCNIPPTITTQQSYFSPTTTTISHYWFADPNTKRGANVSGGCHFSPSMDTYKKDDIIPQAIQAYNLEQQCRNQQTQRDRQVIQASSSLPPQLDPSILLFDPVKDMQHDGRRLTTKRKGIFMLEFFPTLTCICTSSVWQWYWGLWRHQTILRVSQWQQQQFLAAARVVPCLSLDRWPRDRQGMTVMCMCVVHIIVILQQYISHTQTNGGGIIQSIIMCTIVCLCSGDDIVL